MISLSCIDFVKLRMYLKLFAFIMLAVATIQCNVIKNENIDVKISRIHSYATKLNKAFKFGMENELGKPFYFEAMKNLIQQKMDLLETRYFKYVNKTLEQARQTGNVHNISIDSVYYSMFADVFDDPKIVQLTNVKVDELVADVNIRKSLHEKNEQRCSTIVNFIRDYSNMLIAAPVDFAEEVLDPEMSKMRTEKDYVLTVNLQKTLKDIVNEMLVILQTNGISEEEAKQIVSKITLSSL